MTNVPHSGLTGADLHESKGTAAAAVDTVFVADGAGSGTYKKVPNSALAGLGNPFGAQLFQCVELGQTTYSGGGGGWTTRRLGQVITNEIAAGLNGSFQISLPSGTYFCEAASSEYFNNLVGAGGSVVSTQPRLRNLTAGTTLLVGFMNSWSSSSTTVSMNSFLKGRFTLAATSLLTYEVWCNNSYIGLSGPVASGESSSPTNVCIWKIS